MHDTATQSPSCNMTRMTALGAPWWNDSCDPSHLAEAVERGAVGATSNPVIVSSVVSEDPDRWLPVIDTLIGDYPTETEEQIAWRLIAEIGRIAAKVLEPVYQRTEGRAGYLCLQVNPRFHPSPDAMVAHGRELAAVAPNIAIKVPATQAGIEAVERLTAHSVAVNVTVSFTVSQAVAAAQAIERGLEKADNPEAIVPYVTLMEGRIDDHLKRVREAQGVDVDSEVLEWAGVAIFKKTAGLFREKGFRSTLLAAAYRNTQQWSQIIGQDVLQSIPYKTWKGYAQADIEPTLTLDEPIDPAILDTLQSKFEDFNKAYDEGGLAVEAFTGFGPSVHTLNQFITGYEALLAVVRQRMLV